MLLKLRENEIGMENVAYDIDLSLDQRYYFFVLLSSTNNYNLDQFWSEVGNLFDVEDKSVLIDDDDIQVSIRKIITEEVFSRGFVQQNLSFAGNTMPPYRYDVCLMKINLGNDIFYSFAFPFLSLANAVIDTLVEKFELNKKLDFKKVDLYKLIDPNNIRSTENSLELKTHIIGLKLSISGDPTLSAMVIKGKNPLKSVLYQDMISDLIAKKIYQPKQCTFSCELGLIPGLELIKNNIPNKKVRAHIHLDSHGNFRTYIHLAGANIMIFPHFVKKLYINDCFKNASVNPLKRNSIDETSPTN